MQDEIEARELREEDIAPEDASEQPARFVRRHPLAAALAILVGAAALVGGGFAAGTVYGERLVTWLFPSVVAVRDEPVTEQVELEDGYEGALARRVSAAAGDVAANAYEPPTLDEATAGAIEGLLASMGDEGYTYLSQQEYEGYQLLASSEQTGIGATFVDTEQGPTVALVASGSPAERAGLVPGDVIVAVEGERGTWSSLELALALSGEAGDRVSLTWRDAPAARDGNGSQGDGGSQADGAAQPTGTSRAQGIVESSAMVDIAQVSAPLVGSYLEGTVGVVVVPRFVGGTYEQALEAVESLAEQGATSLVLDLRGNAGGDLGEAVRVASLFLTGGTVANEVTRTGIQRIEATTSLHATDLPLVVLVDGDTAHAAEMVAGAMQDHARGHVIGCVTAGRGGSQVVRTLSIGGAIVYATAQYQTPDGHDIQGRGITPDVEVAMDEDLRYARGAERDAQLAAAVDALGGDGPQADAEQPPQPQGQQGQAQQDEPDAQQEAEQAAQQDAEQDEQQDVQQEVEQDEQTPPAEPEQQDEEGRP